MISNSKEGRYLNQGHGDPSGWGEAASGLCQPGRPAAASTQLPWLHEGHVTPGDGQAVLATGQRSPTLHSAMHSLKFLKFSQKKKKVTIKTTSLKTTFHLLKKFQRNLNIQRSKAQSQALRSVTLA